MLYVSLFVELLRIAAALAVLDWRRCCRRRCGRSCRRCSIAAPPGDLPLVLASGHEFQFGTDLGPPLAFWLAEIAFIALAVMFGVYLLSQICVVVTFWAVFALGRAIVGRAACGDGGDADGRHRGVLGADAGVRRRSSSPCRSGR